jgi:hypothetical protein
MLPNYTSRPTFNAVFRGQHAQMVNSKPSPSCSNSTLCTETEWLVGLVYSCCSHLEHRASVKRFISLHFLDLRHSVGPLSRVISPSQGRYLTQTQNKHRQTSMPRVGFETTIPAFEQANTVDALDRAATDRQWNRILIAYSWPAV